MTKVKKTDMFLFAFAIFLLGGLCFIPFGCSEVRGFAYAGDGPLTSSQARYAAEVASAEADALRRIADEQDRSARGMLDAVDSVASSIGAPEIVSALIGAAGGLFITPPTRRKRKVEPAATE